MPLEPRTRKRTSSVRSLNLPPPFRTVALREVGDAFAHAMRIAADEGAGTLVHVGRFDLAEFAVVLEPDEPLSTARRALYVGLAALADSLAAHAPPEKPVTIVWPDVIMIDGGLVGGGRLGWPKGAEEDTPPNWLVFSGMIRMVSLSSDEGGLHPLAAALEDEGFVDLRAERFVESFARYLMKAIDCWQQDGFPEAAKGYMVRLAPEQGARREIDDNGDLLLRRAGAPRIERRALLRALAQPSWLDPETGGPRQ